MGAMQRVDDLQQHLLESVAEAQRGVVTVQQVRQLLGSASAELRFRSDPRWEQVSSRLHRRVDSESTLEQRCVIAVLELGGCTLVSHRSAAMLYGLYERDDQLVHVTTTSKRRQHGGVARLHRVDEVPLEQQRVLGGVPIVSPALLAMQAFGSLPSDDAVDLTMTMMNLGMLERHELEELLERWGERGRNGAGGLRAFLGRRPMAV